MGVSIIHLLVTTSLGSTCLWAAYSSFLPPGEGFSVCKTAQRIWFRLSLVLEGDLKVLDFVYWLKYYYFVFFDSFPFCIFSLL